MTWVFDISEGLAYIMNELFGGVVYAGIDTDKHRYPIGKLVDMIVPLSRHHKTVSNLNFSLQVLVASHLTTRRAFLMLSVQDSLK